MNLSYIIKLRNSLKDELRHMPLFQNSSAIIVENEKVDYIIDDENICINSIYFKNNASDRIPENQHLKVVNNWGEIYKYIILYEEGENQYENSNKRF